MRVAGDVHGDGRADLAGFRDLATDRGSFYAFPGLGAGSLLGPARISRLRLQRKQLQLVQGDFNGDGKTDFAVFVADAPTTS